MFDDDSLNDAIRAAERAVVEAQNGDHIHGVRDGAPPVAPWPDAPCRIVFLDFDGVLNSEQSVRKLGTRYRFARASIDALNTILQETDSLAVITSKWREIWTLREIAGFLERDGMLPSRVVGKTPILEKERGFEIDAWLRSAPFSVASYVILDDRNDMTIHQSRLIQINPEIELDELQARRAIELLHRSSTRPNS